MLAPTVRRTLAPRGQTPVQKCSFRHEKISAISAITVSPKQHHFGLYFTLLPDNENVDAEDIVRYLRLLKRHIPGALTIVRDRSNTHDHAALVRRYLARHPEIVTEKFPGYAPELNPPEQVWTYTKYARLPNFAPCHTSDLRMRLTYELKRLRKRPDLLLSFIRHSKLPLGP
jgi:transposase